MERLTYRDANGELWYSDNGTERDRLHRLAAYEDTGLTPEEIKSLRAEWAVNLKALESYRAKEAAHE